MALFFVTDDGAGEPNIAPRTLQAKAESSAFLDLALVGVASKSSMPAQSSKSGSRSLHEGMLKLSVAST